MVVKGYYANVCLGLTIVTSFLNILGGTGMIGVGFVVGAYPLARVFEYFWIGFLLIFLGSLILSFSIIAIIGTCKENHKMVLSSFVMTLLNIVSLMATVGVIAAMIGRVDTRARNKYNTLPESWRSKYETSHQCCGFDVIEEGVDGCLFKVPCIKRLVREIRNQFKMCAIIIAVCLIFHALGAFSLGCFQKKLGRQKSHELRKEARNLSLLEQGQRPRREKKERKKHAKYSNQNK